jgi:hypothetical protein
MRKNKITSRSAVINGKGIAVIVFINNAIIDIWSDETALPE